MLPLQRAIVVNRDARVGKVVRVPLARALGRESALKRAPRRPVRARPAGDFAPGAVRAVVHRIRPHLGVTSGARGDVDGRAGVHVPFEGDVRAVHHSLVERGKVTLVIVDVTREVKVHAVFVKRLLNRKVFGGL